MSHQDFYVYLSNDGQSKSNDLHVRLPQSIHLDGEWLCSLCEFSCSSVFKQANGESSRQHINNFQNKNETIP